MNILGEPLSEQEVVSSHYEKLTQLQRLAFKHWGSELADLAFMHCGELQKQKVFMKALSKLSEQGLHKLVTKQLKLVDPSDPKAHKVDFLKSILVKKYEKHRLQREAINSMPLYPTEAILWDKHQVIHSLKSNIQAVLSFVLHLSLWCG